MELLSLYHDRLILIFQFWRYPDSTWCSIGDRWLWIKVTPHKMLLRVEKVRLWLVCLLRFTLLVSFGRGQLLPSVWETLWLQSICQWVMLFQASDVFFHNKEKHYWYQIMESNVNFGLVFDTFWAHCRLQVFPKLPKDLQTSHRLFTRRKGTILTRSKVRPIFTIC